MAWGTRVLVWLYKNLGQASCVDARDLWAATHFWNKTSVARSLYIQQFELLETTCGSSMLDYYLRLDTIGAVEVRRTPYSAQEIEGVRSATYHGALTFFYTVEPHMPKRLVYPSPPHIPADVILDALDPYIGDDDPDDVGTSHARFLEISRIVRMY
ncbi:hypothetical protein M9H77_23812 [Catharanthus roseus]|uniref:Uncharacterized protein n=1 Tax=Catharanthus roseus TaxID=4058 RepID=A0ACC0AVC6_CATRO|nr:hypothetical protein M9H77_23812 [Catharanthus roseus]